MGARARRDGGTRAHVTSPREGGGWRPAGGRKLGNGTGTGTGTVGNAWTWPRNGTGNGNVFRNGSGTVPERLGNSEH